MNIPLNIENDIERIYRELSDGTEMNNEFAALYTNIEHEQLKVILGVLHTRLTSGFESMNQRLPTSDTEAYFWAESSRQLMRAIESATRLCEALKGSGLAFEIATYYRTLMERCKTFLRQGGSTLPPHMAKVNLYYKIPIFTSLDAVTIDKSFLSTQVSLKQIGEGSYAFVYKYFDNFYQKHFALKRAKKDLTPIELQRFRLEFDEMKKLSSPYVLEVYRYNDIKNEYVMEYVDYTLSTFIEKRNSSLTIKQRKRLVFQILHVFNYIHSKDRLHRDISPHNILLKEYQDKSVFVKVADFGLVKILNSSLTNASTDFKGSFNDPSLQIEGFKNYELIHEMYALTRLIYYVITGKTSLEKESNSKLKSFVSKGTSSDKAQRFQDVLEMRTELLQLFNEIEESSV
jgi:serine/threonine-protein kinase